jgi:hypothetical protein
MRCGNGYGSGHVHARGGAECGWVEGLTRESEKSKYIDTQGLKEVETLVEYTTGNFQGKIEHDSGVEAYFEIAELCELLAAVIEPAEVGLGLIMDDLVSADVPTLGESLPTDFALVWTFSSVSSFMCLEFLVSRVGGVEFVFCVYL